jgi:SAM-dependent methyltransferase
MKRVVAPELLDSDAGSAREIADSLRDLRMINRRFGGIGAMRKLLDVAISLEADPNTTSGLRESELLDYTLLDIASGDGDLSRETAREAAADGRHVDVTLLDRSASHFSSVQNVRSRVAASALALPFRDRSFDLVCCSLFIHHLSEDEALLLMREGLRVCRRAVIISDLRRDPLHFALALLGRVIYRSRLTRNDAPASVRAAFTSAELGRLAAASGPHTWAVMALPWFRLGAILWPKPQQERA